MFKKVRKFGQSVNGFTLTEVMIGMLILTVAIVSATNLLIGLISSNQNNLTTLQAYYLSQEGLEAVRNIRDTNWLHNRGWLGKDSEQLWGGSFEIPNDEANYSAVNLEYFAFNEPASGDSLNTVNEVAAFRPWSIDNANSGKIFRNVDGDNVYLGPNKGAESVDTGFKRTIVIQKYDCEKSNVKLPCDAENKDKYVFVESKVEWNLGAKQREFTLSEVLTDWKGGAL